MARIWIGLGGAEDTGQHGGDGAGRVVGTRARVRAVLGVTGGDQESSEGDRRVVRVMVTTWKDSYQAGITIQEKNQIPIFFSLGRRTPNLVSKSQKRSKCLQI